MTAIANPTVLEIRQEIAEITGFPLAAVSSYATATRFAIDRSMVDGQRLQDGIARMAGILASDGVSLFHVRPQGGTRQVRDIRLGTWQHYTMRKTA